jgi:acetyl esterase
MPLDPRLQPLVDLMNAQAPADDTGMSVAELRARAHAGMELSYLAMGDPGPDVASIVDHRIAVGGDGIEPGEITVRVYTPDGAGPFPGHLYLHGGGFWLGEPAQFDSNCKAIAAGAGCVVASVDYRLAPEHRFPVAPEDCYTALQWFVAHADDLGVDPRRVSVGGGSAGGNLSAVVALMARDRSGPSLVFQVLEIPVTDLTGSHPSIEENGEGYLLTKAGMQQCVDYYLAEPGDAKHPYASPLFASDLSGLPSALVMTAEFDPLRDEGEAYGARLQEAGVPTVVRRWDGQFHGSQSMSKVIPDAAAEYRDMVCAALRDAYARP